MVIQTYDGKLVDLRDLKPSDVTPTHLAKSLSLKARFNGSTEVLYSVAQHSLLVAHLMPPDAVSQLAGLLHDGAEAFTGDILGPIKAEIKELQQLDWKIQWSVYERFGVRMTEQLLLEVDIFDKQLCATEKRDLLKPSDPWPMPLPDPLSFHIIPMQSRDAELKFLARLEELEAQLKPKEF